MMREEIIMRYFLVIGLMMVGSVAQADICIPLWWRSATDVQVEREAELKGPFVMNELCENGRMPVDLALENSRDPLVFAAILKNFELDEETRSQVIRFMTDIQRETLRLQGLWDEYPEQYIEVLPIIESDFDIHVRDRLNMQPWELLQFSSDPENYKRVKILLPAEQAPEVNLLNVFYPDTENDWDLLRFFSADPENYKMVEILLPAEQYPEVNLLDVLYPDTENDGDK